MKHPAFFESFFSLFDSCHIISLEGSRNCLLNTIAHRSNHIVFIIEVREMLFNE